MKKVFFNCLVAFSLLLQVGCNDQEMETVESVHSSVSKISNECHEIAKIMASISLTADLVQEMKTNVESALCNGLEESVYFADLLQDPAVRSNCKQNVIGNLIRQQMRQTRGSEYSVTEDDLQFGNYQIYWPYSENWDGETIPLNTFVLKMIPNYGIMLTV